MVFSSSAAAVTGCALSSIQRNRLPLSIKSIAFSISFVRSLEVCLAHCAQRDLLSGLINKWCSIYDVKVSCRIFFYGSNRFSALHLFHANTHTVAHAWPVSFGHRPSVLISNKLENAEKTIFLSTTMEGGERARAVRSNDVVLPYQKHEQKNTKTISQEAKTFRTTWRRSVRRKQSPKIGLVFLRWLCSVALLIPHQDSISQTYGARSISWVYRCVDAAFALFVWLAVRGFEAANADNVFSNECSAVVHASCPFSTWTFLEVDKPKTDHLYFIRGLSATTTLLYCNDTRINMFRFDACAPWGQGRARKRREKDSTNLKHISAIYHFICIWPRSTCLLHRPYAFRSTYTLHRYTSSISMKENRVNDEKGIQKPNGRRPDQQCNLSCGRTTHTMIWWPMSKCSFLVWKLLKDMLAQDTYAVHTFARSKL